MGMSGQLEKDIQITGATDNTNIGNVSDRLKVDASFSSPPRISNSYSGIALHLDDMNVANGGVARGTAISSTTVYTTVFSYTGSGHLFSYLISLEGNLVGADPFNVKLTIDGTTIYELNTLDIATATIYNLGTDGDENTMGVSTSNNTFRYKFPSGGLYYASSISIAVKKAAGGSKQFRAGLVHLTKET